MLKRKIVLLLILWPTLCFPNDRAPSGEPVQSLQQTVGHGENGMPVLAVPNIGYHFTTWSDGRTDNPRTDTNVTADINVTAYFEINKYTVIHQIDGTAGATFTGVPVQTVDYGSSTTAVLAVPPSWCVFAGWTKGGEPYSKDNPLVITNITTDTMVMATFERPYRPAAAKDWEYYY